VYGPHHQGCDWRGFKSAEFAMSNTKVKRPTHEAIKIFQEFTLTEHVDPGHAWLAVPRTLIEALGLERRISPYSYEDAAGIIYLEEDFDQHAFISAAMDHDLFIEEIEQCYHDDFCFIRKLPRYKRPTATGRPGKPLDIC
jgi:hypothetical protein